jgi:hypothetical protein
MNYEIAVSRLHCSNGPVLGHVRELRVRLVGGYSSGTPARRNAFKHSIVACQLSYSAAAAARWSSLPPSYNMLAIAAIRRCCRCLSVGLLVGKHPPSKTSTILRPWRSQTEFATSLLWRVGCSRHFPRGRLRMRTRDGASTRTYPPSTLTTVARRET